MWLLTILFWVVWVTLLKVQRCLILMPLHLLLLHLRFKDISLLITVSQSDVLYWWSSVRRRGVKMQAREQNWCYHVTWIVLRVIFINAERANSLKKIKGLPIYSFFKLLSMNDLNNNNICLRTLLFWPIRGRFHQTLWPSKKLPELGFWQKTQLNFTKNSAT